MIYHYENNFPALWGDYNSWTSELVRVHYHAITPWWCINSQRPTATPCRHVCWQLHSYHEKALDSKSRDYNVNQWHLQRRRTVSIEGPQRFQMCYTYNSDMVAAVEVSNLSGLFYFQDIAAFKKFNLVISSFFWFPFSTAISLEDLLLWSSLTLNDIMKIELVI